MPLLILVFWIGSGEARGTFGGFVAGVLLGFAAAFAFLWVYEQLVSKRSLEHSLRKWENAEVTFIIDEQGIRTRSPFGSSEDYWEQLTDFQIRDGLWLFSFGELPLALPESVLEKPVQDLITRNINKARQSSTNPR